MEQKSRQILCALINRYHQGPMSSLLTGMPAEEIQEITATVPSLADPSHILIYPKELFATKIHYSWTAEVLKTFTGDTSVLFASSLPANQAELALRLLPQHGRPLLRLSKLAKDFLLQALAKKIGICHVTPPALLPTEQLSMLVDFTKEQLLQLVDFLCLYDLAEEIKSIVDKNTLQLIYNGLSPQKLRFLKNCLYQKEKFSTSKIGLTHWQGNEEQLQNLLHRRGLLRLASALSGQHPHLLWHISHRLDIGRGRLLEKNYAKKEIPGVTVPLRLQVINIINFLKKVG